MLFEPLLASLPAGAVLTMTGPQPASIRAIRYDSREVTPGDLFVAWRGFRRDGHDFVPQAVERGAAAVVCERALPHVTVPQVVVRNGREALAHLAAAYYGHPSRRLKLVGVTGTNGKTTTTYLIKAVLEAAGHRVGLIGTIRNFIGDEALEARHTTPESLDLQALLASMVERGVTHCVMEVSSHAVALQRTVMCHFAAGVFTNITQDHLDFHGTFDEYLQAKANFFRHIGPEDDAVAVVNVDDPHGEEIAAQARVPVVRYGLLRPGDFTAREVTIEPQGASYVACTPRGSFPLQLRLTGQFNVYNSLAAVAVAEWAGIDHGVIKRGLESVMGIPGRFEKVDLGQDFTVLVDYAHTPDSLENVLRAARAFTAGRLWVVFGCGGDRDAAKRPLMGEAAARLADRVIITSDNPRSEDPESICREVFEGAQRVAGGADVEVVVERREAIRKAIREAEPHDLIVIAGKGHETYQIFRDHTIHFDDREEAAAAIRERLAR